MVQHAPSCPLYPRLAGEFRHAIAAAGRFVAQDEHDPDDVQHFDQTTAMALMDSLARLAELPEWETVTLNDVAEDATLMNTPEMRELLRPQCTCGALA